MSNKDDKKDEKKDDRKDGDDKNMRKRNSQRKVA